MIAIKDYFQPVRCHPHRRSKRPWASGTGKVRRGQFDPFQSTTPSPEIKCGSLLPLKRKIATGNTCGWKVPLQFRTRPCCNLCRGVSGLLSGKATSEWCFSQGKKRHIHYHLPLRPTLFLPGLVAGWLKVLARRVTAARFCRRKDFETICPELKATNKSPAGPQPHHQGENLEQLGLDRLHRRRGG